jgi:hypothetical protein
MGGYNSKFRKNDLAELQGLANHCCYAKFYLQNGAVVTPNDGNNVEKDISGSGWTEEWDNRNWFAVADPNGAVTYNGPNGVACKIYSNTLSRSSTAAVLSIFRLRQNGDYLTGSYSKMYTKENQTYSTTNIAVATLNNGDVIKLTWQPTNGTQDLTVESHQMVFVGMI